MRFHYNMVEIKKIYSQGEQKIVCIPKRSNLQIGQYVAIIPIHELNKETGDQSAKKESPAIPTLNQNES